MSTVSNWPKARMPISREEELAWERFIVTWHEILPRRYKLIERFNHTFPIRFARSSTGDTVEIGAGRGGHIGQRRLSPEAEGRYYAIESRESMAAEIRMRYPRVNLTIADCERRLPFEDGRFERCVAVHVLEHLPNLPACVREVWRLLDKSRGQLLVVIPCEGGHVYSLARGLSAKRMFEKTYGFPYEHLIQREHLNRPHEVIQELNRYFVLEHRRLFPFPFLPAITANLCVGLALRPRLDAIEG